MTQACVMKSCHSERPEGAKNPSTPWGRGTAQGFYRKAQSGAEWGSFLGCFAVLSMTAQNLLYCAQHDAPKFVTNFGDTTPA